MKSPKPQFTDIQKGQIRELKYVANAKLYINMHGFGAYVKMRLAEIDKERMSNPPSVRQSSRGVEK